MKYLLRSDPRVQCTSRCRVDGTLMPGSDRDAQFDQSACFLIQGSGLVALFSQGREGLPNLRVSALEFDDRLRL